MRKTPTFKNPFLSAVIFLCLCLIVTSSFSQSKSKILKASNNKNFTLIFPSAIRQATVGSSNFSFSFDINNESKLGILKGLPGIESNLLVITKEGNIYSYILNYEKNLNELSYFVKREDALGNMDGGKIISDEVVETSLDRTLEENKQNNTIENEITENDFYEETEKFESDREYLKQKSEKLYTHDKALYLKKFSGYIIGKETYFKRYFTLSDNVILSLNNIIFSNNEVYFYLELENKGVLDYDVNYVNLYITSKNKGKRSSSQKLKYEPIYTYNLPKRVGSFRKATFVLVFSKFSIGKNKVAIVDINESKGERNLKLEISHENINNPNILYK